VSLEETLRGIVREEIRAALADQGKAPPAHLINSADLCAALGISRGTLRKMMADGCPHVRPGTYPRFDLEHVKRWMNAR
jgi:excisionase family DNA binding protein